MGAPLRSLAPVVSIRAISAVWDRSTASGNDLLVLLALADYVGKDDDHCWPSQESIANKTRLSLSTVRRSLRSLEALGEVVTGPHAGPRYENARRPLNTYRLTLIAGQSDRSKPVRSAQIAGQIGEVSRSAVTGRTGSNREGTPASTQKCSKRGHEHATVTARLGCTACRFENLGPAGEA